MIQPDDAAEMYDVDEFAETVTIGGTPVAATFDAAYVEAGDVEGATPAITLPDATVPAGTDKGTPVVARGLSYKVRNFEPDSHGITRIRLLKV